MAFDAFALMLTMLALGMLFTRLKLLPGSAAEVLNLVVLYVCLPAAVLIYVPRLQVDASLIGVIVTPWVLAVVSVALVTLATRTFGFRRDEHAVLLLCVVLGNTSFIGYPMVRALLGEEALPYAVVYDQFGTFLLLSTFGLYVLAKYGGDAPPTLRQVVLRIVKFPPVWALLLGLTVMPEQPPTWIATGLQKLADALLPLVMLAVGLSIQLKMPRDEVKPLAVGLMLKLVILPALALPLALWFGLDDDMLQVSVLESAMPTMITAGALAIAHNLAPRLAAALVGYGILLSLVTLPAWVWVLGWVSPA